MDSPRNFIIRFTLLAFLLNAILPFFAVYDIPSRQIAALKNSASPFGDTIMICTGNGYKLVSWADIQSGKVKSDNHSPASHYQCALCFLAAHGLQHLAAPGAIVLAYARTITASGVIGYTERGIRFYQRSFLHSRAPPFFLL